MRNIMILIITLLLFALPATSFAFLGVEMAVGGWQQNPSGTLGYKPLLTGDLIDLEQDAKYDDETRPYGRVKIELPLFIPNLYLMATPMEFEGYGNKNFKFGDITVNGDFYSNIVLDHYDLAFYWGIPGLKTLTLNRVNIEWGLNIRLIDFEATVADKLTLTTETTTETLAIPMVYLGAEFGLLKSLALQLEGRGITISGSSYYDFIGRIKYKPFPGPLFIAAGYRYEAIDIDEDDILADMEFDGPFAELGLKF